MKDLVNKKIFIAGHRGLVGSAILRRLEACGCKSLIFRTSSELDLRSQQATRDFFEEEHPEIVFLSAAKVGGIAANDTKRAEFIYDNLMIASNVIESAYRSGVEWLLNLGSSCIYPKFAPQPMKEDALLTGALESTNEPYAIANIAALKMVESYNRQYGTNFYSAMPTNLYGPNDNFDLQGSHVIPALMRKFHEAKTTGQTEVVLWGDGSPRREFLHVEDLADACLFLYQKRSDLKNFGYFVNVGYGEDLSIAELADKVRTIVGFKGDVIWDTTKPNGTPRKLMDVSKLLNIGWKPTTKLDDGLRSTYDWYLSAAEQGSARI